MAAARLVWKPPLLNSATNLQWQEKGLLIVFPSRVTTTRATTQGTIFATLATATTSHHHTSHHTRHHICNCTNAQLQPPHVCNWTEMALNAHLDERSDNLCAGNFAKNEIPINWTSPSLETNRNHFDGLTIITTPPPPTFELTSCFGRSLPDRSSNVHCLGWEGLSPFVHFSPRIYLFSWINNALAWTLSDPLCSTPSIDLSLSLSVLPDLLLFSCPGGTFPSLLSHPLGWGSNLVRFHKPLASSEATNPLGVKPCLSVATGAPSVCACALEPVLCRLICLKLADISSHGSHLSGQSLQTGILHQNGWYFLDIHYIHVYTYLGQALKLYSQIVYKTEVWKL